MFSWWPKIIPIDYVLPLRTLGRKNLRMGKKVEHVATNADLRGGNDSHKEYLSSLFSRETVWDGQLSLAEQEIRKRINPCLLFVLARILADGPKLFVMPAGMEDSLNKIELPLAVKDFFPPFPACVVQRENGEFHYVVHSEGTLSLVVVNGRTTDVANMFADDRTIESYLSDVRRTQQIGEGIHAIVDDDAFAEHRFRATLNFLLLCTMQGIVSRGPQNNPKLIGGKPHLKHANAELFHPQDIELFRRRSSNATTPNPVPDGSSKRPHFRRAHWRRAAIGTGRGQRELRLIRCCFVNKSKLVSCDGDFSYTAVRKPR
jgi:hypothetical protein